MPWSEEQAIRSSTFSQQVSGQELAKRQPAKDPWLFQGHMQELRSSKSRTELDEGTGPNQAPNEYALVHH